METQSVVASDWHHFLEDGVLIVDAADRIIQANRSFLELMGVGNVEHPEGRELFALLEPVRFPFLKEAIEVARKPAVSVGSMGIWHNRRLLDLRARPCAEGVCVVVRDMTESYQLETALHRSTIITRLIQAVAIVATEATNWKPVLQAALRNLCGAFDWQYAQVFVPAKANPGEMKASTFWHSKHEGQVAANPGEIEQALIRLNLALELPVRSAAEHQPIWLREISEDSRFQSIRPSNELGIRSAFAFPVRLGEQVVAVLTFFSSNKVLEQDHLQIEVSDFIADQVARVLERENSARIIMDQQMKLAASSKLSALGEMAGGIAHEINNPLAAIHAMASQLRELAEEEQITCEVAAQIAEKIERTSMRIAKIVKGLRVLARDGENDPVECVSVKSVVDDTLGFCAERLRARGVEITFEDACPDARVLARGIQMAQVLLNLINNSFDAIQSLEKKWIRIRSAQEGASVEISVTDSGKGIPYDVQERIFIPFFTTKEVGKGTGLGLSLSRAIMEGQGGGLFYDPTHENTRFVIRVPKG